MSGNVSPKQAQQLLQTLEHALGLSTRLNSMLEEEKNLLVERQYSAYQLALKDKTQLLVQLDQADHDRRKLMGAMGFNPDRNGFQDFLQLVPASWRDKFSATWDQLVDSMNDCSRQNQVNGKILAHSQVAVERLMLIIRGTGPQPSTYKSDGRRSLGASQRVLATA